MGLLDNTFTQLAPQVGDANATEALAQRLAQYRVFPRLDRERLNDELTAVAAWRQVAALERIAAALEEKNSEAAPVVSAPIAPSTPAATIPTGTSQPIRLTSARPVSPPSPGSQSPSSTTPAAPASHGAANPFARTPARAPAQPPTPAPILQSKPTSAKTWSVTLQDAGPKKHWGKTLLNLMPDLGPDDVVARVNAAPCPLAAGIAIRDHALRIKASLNKLGAVITIE
ncbi:hypothetical protein Csp1_26900 [Corynebacterium provencense]|uniref:Uncharacterized protein n=1 Tax=Corynebacterium provencense TaxID=1737425 RepID=A0A2Z3Z1F7_9CORY|nr:hypothetical protein [Corynebacterium provencense]AWT27433.1 hypothetical protein Csp1_26900 [Corynebacterium provencense]